MMTKPEGKRGKTGRVGAGMMTASEDGDIAHEAAREIGNVVTGIDIAHGRAIGEGTRTRKDAGIGPEAASTSGAMAKTAQNAEENEMMAESDRDHAQRSDGATETQGAGRHTYTLIEGGTESLSINHILYSSHRIRHWPLNVLQS